MTGTAGADGGLDGTWVLVEVGGKRVSVGAGQAPNFTISGKEISGFDGCNRFGGRLDRPGEIVATRMACLGDYVALPLDFEDVAAHLSRGKRSGDTLRLPAWGDFPASVFKRS